MRIRFVCLFVFIVMLANPIFGQKLESLDKFGKNGILIEKTTDTKKADGYIFPISSGKLKRRYPGPKPKVIITGVFTGNKKEDRGKEKQIRDEKSDNNLSEPLIIKKTEDIKFKADKDTIAWIKANSEYYHDPLSPHELDSEKNTDGQTKHKLKRIWISDIKFLAGLKPCKKCFIDTNTPPEFIKKECGGLDLASASALLNNPEFIEWAKKHLPVEKVSFLTSSKILAVAKTKMTDKALLELAKEIAAAYRRHTWRIAEVITQNKNSEKHESSF